LLRAAADLEAAELVLPGEGRVVGKTIKRAWRETTAGSFRRSHRSQRGCTRSGPLLFVRQLDHRGGALWQQVCSRCSMTSRASSTTSRP
jgi:hypothetical protein